MGLAGQQVRVVVEVVDQDAVLPLEGLGDLVALWAVTLRLILRQLTAVLRPVVLIKALGAVRLDNPQIDVRVVSVPRDRHAQVMRLLTGGERFQPIAEVVRDLYRSESQPEQSYSERQLYEAALDRLAREISAAQDVDESIALQRVAESLAKGGRLQRKHSESLSGEDSHQDEAA